MSTMPPWRGAWGTTAGRPRDVPLPPGRMPPLVRGRPLKRWRYVGAFGEDVMLCAGYARVGPVPQAWWAVWDRRTGRLHERTAQRRAGVRLPPGRVLVRDRAAAIDLRYELRGPTETVSPHGRSHIWTRKSAVALEGSLMIDGEPRHVRLRGVLDDSAGYHARHTLWRWSAGIGATPDGREVAWNLVEGVHDDPDASERTVWVDGEPHHVPGGARFAADLSSVVTGDSRLDFTAEATREARMNVVVARNTYRQPFGRFSGELPVVGAVRDAFGVMEFHDVLW